MLLSDGSISQVWEGNTVCFDLLQVFNLNSHFRVLQKTIQNTMQSQTTAFDDKEQTDKESFWFDNGDKRTFLYLQVILKAQVWQTIQK